LLGRGLRDGQGGPGKKWRESVKNGVPLVEGPGFVRHTVGARKGKKEVRGGACCYTPPKSLDCDGEDWGKKSERWANRKGERGQSRKP